MFNITSPWNVFFNFIFLLQKVNVNGSSRAVPDVVGWGTLMGLGP